MIALLTGKLAHKSPDFIILDVNGVGYRVQIPFSTYYALPEGGSSVSLNIFTHVKEDAINLYGFRTMEEKEMFQLLISVSGIGPKLGNGILSNIEAQNLSDALIRGDLARLATIPGIGKKTAERLVLELREKVKKLGHGPLQQDVAPADAHNDMRDDVVSALVNLGYKEAVVQKTVDEIGVAADATVESLLKQALKKLMK
ncbi:Holliday junction DNA helicase RuvA [Geotalea daltonii FRC-32]|uniref:Holliday junction branch migration complex subunit RuvA n=1 Tax=Geotalea daltonii (strain DSM 22248 / JCM 15807 / FRC-32) TaxID=316067 RepID=RUVA_GEODF|nr:Holliday junction branch migration protein RuvA [Geotalea daltonii]B9LZC5.1 RecName: Full=Holliday junction branch migration complex subunit RuvA [Geotalea daltonii FRC-32]ACM20678.1 Holliday junction DNA helicase RuvA [Geotalea daltonii FRC-32]